VIINGWKLLMNCAKQDTSVDFMPSINKNLSGIKVLHTGTPHCD